MTKKGYSYDSPLTVMGSEEFAQGDISDRERDAAQADISCKQEVDLVPRWNAVESTIENRLISGKNVILGDFLERQNAKVAAARKILKD